MKKKLFVIILILFASAVNSNACNVCGCGVGNYHYGILPQFRKNFVGVRYRYSTYISKLDDAHASPYSYETFQTAELWGRFYPAKKIQTFIFVPFNFNERREGMDVKSLKGLGDIVVSANYNLVNTYDSLATVKHNVLVGGGVKLPTGEFQAIENGLTVNQNFQLGTGSIDFLINLIYTIRYKNVGLNSEFTSTTNTKNKDQYRFGNSARAALTAFYVVRSDAFTLMPNVGISGEFFKDNEQFSVEFPDTGGWASLINLGTEIYYRGTAFGFSYSHPGKQGLFNNKVTANDRMSMHLTFMF
jgi:hypothetical protein